MNEGMKTCGKPSRGRYVQGCRCYMCRVANADYSREQASRSKWAHSAMVGKDATSRARRIVQGWLDEGHTMREICRATGVPRKSMDTLMSGRHPNAAKLKNGKPKSSKRMSRKNYEAIAKCTRLNGKAGGQLVDSAPARAMIAWLTGHGMTRYRIAKESGVPVATVYQMEDREKCEHKTMVKLARVAVRLKEECS